MTEEISYKKMAVGTLGMATALTWLGLAGLSLTAQAHEVPGKSLRTMTEEADLIFQGVVSKVEYGMAPGTESEDAELPQTYVTFQMEDVEKGQSTEGKAVTLRFLGGPAKDGRILVVSNAPLFDEGERVMLFVENNGESECPLVDCDKGRFRVINNQMFTNDGHEVRQTPQGNIFFGKQHRLPEVLNNKIGNLPFNFELDPEEAEGEEKGKTQYNRGEGLRIQGEHLNIQKFKGRIAQEKVKIRPEKLAALKPVRSLKPGQALPLRPHTPQVPNARVAPERPDAVPMNEFDKQEAEFLMKNAMNPVLKEGPPGGLKPNLQIKPNLGIQKPLIPNLNMQKPLRVIPRGIEGGGEEAEMPLEGNMLFDAEDMQEPGGEVQP
ncbi:MAG: hypothetical protein R3B74_12335 [Nitrospirales bacterium]|nr:hypothetical protein [Nitrospirales bacterium]